MIASVVFVVFPICLALAALTDFFEMTIPNRIPVILLASFVLVAPFAGLGWSQFGLHLAAGAIVFSVGFVLFALNAMGGGDAKLLTAAAVWYGFDPSLYAFMLYVAYLGGGLTLLILVIRAHTDVVSALGLTLPDSIVTARKIPYGIAIGAAGLLTYPQSPLVLWALEGMH